MEPPAQQERDSATEEGLLLARVDTEHTADAAEFCPFAKQLTEIEGADDLFAVGTYELQQSTGRRFGSVTLYQLHHAHAAPNASAEEDSHVTLSQRHKIETEEGVLDLKWNHHLLGQRAVLAGAQAGARLTLWALSPGGNGDELALEALHSQVFEEASEGSLCLSLDWNNKLINSGDPGLVVSHSDGKLSLWNCGQSELMCSHSWDAHELEAWIAAFNHWQPNVVYSGSDDCKLKGWDLRVGTDAPLFTKRHEMGVTTAQMHPLREFYLATGSYDEIVSIWDVRAMSGRCQPLVQRRIEGGGVWRVKWHPYDPSLLAVAAMHKGFVIMQWDTRDTAPLECIVRYNAHDSLGYGIDWSYHKQGSYLASCSFYDHQCTLWKPQHLPQLDVTNSIT